MMRAAAVLAVLLSSCTAAPPRVHLVVPAPAPAPVVVTEVQPVVVRVPADQPPRGRALLAAYDRTRPALGAAVARAHRPDTVDRLAALDRAVRQALQPFRNHPRRTTEAQVETAIDALGALRVALAALPH